MPVPPVNITVPASGNRYVLTPMNETSSVNTDYRVQPVITPTPVNTSVVGYMQWDGNGIQTWNYIALDWQYTNVGKGADLASTVALLDAYLIAQGISPLS